MSGDVADILEIRPRQEKKSALDAILGAEKKARGKKVPVVVAAAAATVFALLFNNVACACETVLTHAEIAAADRARAVEFISTAASNTQLGLTVNAAGDVNGDGFDDFAIASPYAESLAGAIFIVFGRSAEAWKSAQFDFFNASDTPDPASWVKVAGTNTSMRLGYNGVARGDFNGDGFGDLLLSTQSVGKAFCVFGHSGSWSSSNTDELESGAAPGFAVLGSQNSVKFVGNAGDMNGDGIEDLLVMDFQVSTGVIGFIVFGVVGATRNIFSLSTVDGTNGFKLVGGSSGIGNGNAFGPTGDINGDGLADFAIGAYNSGRAYVLFARNVSSSGQQWPASFNLSSEIDGTNGFMVEALASTKLGWTVVGAGDVNGDGFDDLFIGSSSGSAGAWTVFGHPAPWTSPLNVSQVDGTNGFHYASSSNDYMGYSGGGAGDVNGDGFDDIIASGFYALNSFGTKTGAAVLIFGHGGSWPAELDRNDAVGSVGFFIDGPSKDSYFGASSRGAGDVNGDGFADFVIGAYGHSSWKGYAALMFGTPDDHCAVCSNTTDDCLFCEDGFFLNGAVCTNTSVASSSSPSSSAASAAVVVIETKSSSSSASELAEEVSQLLGVNVDQIRVVEITPGTFEVTVINQDVAQQLVDSIEICVEEEEGM